MAVTYTTASIVADRVKYISSDLTTAKIEENINMAENVIDTSLKYSFISTFDADKHRIIRQICTDLAAYYCIIYDPGEFPSMETAELTANLLWNSAMDSLEKLKDPRQVRYLKSL